MRFVAVLFALSCGFAVRSADTAVVITENPGGGPERTVARALVDGGYAVRTLRFDAAVQAGALDGVRMVALPDATRLPLDLHAPLERHLHRGGHLVALGLPAWRTALIRIGGKWVDADAYAKQAAIFPAGAPHPVPSGILLKTSDWTRSANNLNSPAAYEALGPMDFPTIHATVDDLTSWDTLTSPSLPRPFAPGEDRTVFVAKGGPRTTALAVEWIEKDGARWIGTVVLTPEWRRYEMRPEEFKFWPSASGRGGPGDRFQPANADRISFGLAFSHTGTVGGRHEWWVRAVGTATAAQAPLSAIQGAESIDGLYPAWKSFRISDPEATMRPAAHPLTDGLALRAPLTGARSPHPRPSGAGFGKSRPRRWLPLLEAYSPTGVWRGAPGALYLHDGDRYGQGVWAVYGIADRGFYASEPFRRHLTRVARFTRGPRLYEGGTSWYTVFPDEGATYGARVVSPEPGNTVEMRFVDRSGKTLLGRRWRADAIEPGRIASLPRAKGPLAVETRLVRGGVVLDRIRQELHVWQASRPPRFITAKDGRFLQGGRPWKAHGVNYMPSSGIARDRGEQDDFEYWMGASAYDPEIVSRDLDNVKRLGLNAVSIFIYNRSLEDGNLLDILRQCTERGIKVNLSLRPGTPMDDGQWDLIRPIIEKYRLKENDTVFAYDLAWEPNWGNRGARAVYDGRWTGWVRARYGNIEAAEKAWGYTARRAGSDIEGPSDREVTFDGAWRKMVLDYRDFLGELLRERYGAQRQRVLGVDPNHLVSFRMSEAGNPTFQWEGFLPYDFPKLAEAVDFLAPEAYGRIGDWEKVKPGWFEVQYARAVAPGLPVVWAEVGVSAWEPGRDEAPGDRLEAQETYFRAFYRMMNAAGANGIFFWWYPGGYRTNEDSDFGILNPDGTDRPASRAIRDNAAAFLASAAPVKTDATVEVQTGLTCDGPWGLYQQAMDRWWELVAAGKSPALRLR
jgi:hypothetical protein